MNRKDFLDFWKNNGAYTESSLIQEAAKWCKKYNPLYCPGCEDFVILERTNKFQCQGCSMETEWGEDGEPLVDYLKRIRSYFIQEII